MSGDKRREENAGVWTNANTGTHWNKTMNDAANLPAGSVSTRPGGIPPQTLQMRRMGGRAIGFVATADGMDGQVHGFGGDYHQKYNDQKQTYRPLSPPSQLVLHTQQQALEAMEAVRGKVDRTSFSPMQQRRPGVHAHLMSTLQPADQTPSSSTTLSPMNAAPSSRPSASTSMPAQTDEGGDAEQ